MRLIDADALKRQIQQGIDPHNFSAVMAAGAFFGEVDKSPTVDAVHVVRCGECEYFNPLHAFCLMGTNGADFYCARGKRREE